MEFGRNRNKKLFSNNPLASKRSLTDDLVYTSPIIQCSAHVEFPKYRFCPRCSGVCQQKGNKKIQFCPKCSSLFCFSCLKVDHNFTECEGYYCEKKGVQTKKPRITIDVEKTPLHVLNSPKIRCFKTNCEIPLYRFCPFCNLICKSHKVKVHRCSKCGTKFCFNCLRTNDDDCRFFTCHKRPTQKCKDLPEHIRKLVGSNMKKSLSNSSRSSPRSSASRSSKSSTRSATSRSSKSSSPRSVAFRVKKRRSKRSSPYSISPRMKKKKKKNATKKKEKNVRLLPRKTQFGSYFHDHAYNYISGINGKDKRRARRHPATALSKGKQVSLKKMNILSHDPKAAALSKKSRRRLKLVPARNLRRRSIAVSHVPRRIMATKSRKVEPKFVTDFCSPHPHKATKDFRRRSMPPLTRKRVNLSFVDRGTFSTYY